MIGGLAGLLCAILISPASVLGQIDPSELLPVEEAFALSAEADEDSLRVSWEIADGYYMYRHRFRFEPVDAELELGDAILPAGERIVDEFFGATETYRHGVSADIPLLAVPGDGRVELMVHSQGCADLGVCYPPHRQLVSLVVDSAPAETVPARPGLALTQLTQPPGGITFTGPDVPLPEEEAFRYEAIAVDPATLLVRFTAADGYYLYRDQFEFELVDTDAVRIVRVTLPAAEPMFDEFFGDTFVYFGEVEIPVHLSRRAGPAAEIDLRADFQGCQLDGICYPPMNREVTVALPAAQTDIRPDTDRDDQAQAPAAPVSEQDRLAGALAGTPLAAIGLFFVAGILLAFTPCVFPMVPILSGLIAGEGERLTTGRAFRLSLVYVIAMALVYTAFGVIAGLFGQNLQAAFQHPLVLSAFAALFVALALAMFGFYDLQMPASWQTRLSEWSNRAESGTLIGAAVMGALSALVVGPCVAPALMGALIYIGQSGDAVLGGGALFAMAMGMGIPLIAWGASAGNWMPRAGRWMAAVKAVFGVGLLALAIWMLERVIPPAATMILWGALAIACGVYLGALTRLSPDVSGWHKLWQAVGVMLLVLGILQFIGAASGGRDWMRPLAGLTGGASTAAAVQFTPVHTAADLDAALAVATGPVFLDFYADWCVDCKRMERRTFTDPAVAERLARFTLLKMDLTTYDEHHQEVLARYGLIGPPAYLFFHGGDELESLRLFGFTPPARFTEHLDRVRQIP